MIIYYNKESNYFLDKNNKYFKRSSYITTCLKCNNEIRKWERNHLITSHLLCKQCFSKVIIKKEKIKLVEKECFLCKEILEISKFGLTGSGYYKKSCITCSNLKSVFNITRLEYIELLKNQNYKCAICKKHESTIINNKVINLAVDHCHKTNKIRGLLCTNCNQGLGQFKDNCNNLNNAIEYLKKNEN